MPAKKSSKSRTSTQKRSPQKKNAQRVDDASEALTETQYGDVKIHRGSGGETRQQRDGQPMLTTAQGLTIADDQNTLTAGERGPQLLEDFVMREKLFHFDHERIPERVVHARGTGAKGYFESYEDLSDLTSASIFAKAGKRTDVFTRFSTVAGSKGSPDLARDVRGFAVKFYTDQGNWDLVGNNIPVFFIQDAMKFPDLVHSVKPEPDRGFPQAQSAHDNFWDFISLMPEAMHMALWVMSDRAIPRGLQFMEGFGVHTFRLVNAQGESTYVKFHWKPVLGSQSVTWDEAVKINGADPDYHRRTLWNAIEQGAYPAWELGIQAFDDEFADSFEFDILDPTKLIPEEQIPVRAIGRMVLDQNVDNFFAETEQVAFCTQNVVPGIDFTNDPLLQGRNFSYLDTQLKRLGSPNFAHLPVNAPRCPFANFQQDGHMATHQPTGRANYEPNSWGKHGGPREDAQAGYQSFASKTSGDKRRIRPESFADHYSQAHMFYQSQTEIEQQHIADAFAFELSKVERPDIRERMLAHLVNVDKSLAKDVADGLGLNELPDAPKPAKRVKRNLAVSDALSLVKNPPTTLVGRSMGALIHDGVDARVLSALRKACKAADMSLKLVAPTVSGITDSKGNSLEIAATIDGGPSVLFDAVAILVPEDQVDALRSNPSARQFIADADAHAKFVGYVESAASLIESVVPDWTEDRAGYAVLESTQPSADAFIESVQSLRCWSRVDG